MLPEPIIGRLNRGSQLIADAHREVSILFTDAEGFSSIAATLPTAEVIVLLNEMSTIFDGLVDRFGVHKVETTGAVFMAVAGHESASRDDHVQRTLAMGKAMVNATAELRLPEPVARHDCCSEPLYDESRVPLRCGVHTGAAFAGVVGAKRPRYCFFGKTVDVAMSLLSHGFGELVQVSAETRDAAVAGYHAKSSSKGIKFGADDFMALPPRTIDGVGDQNEEVETYVLRDDAAAGRRGMDVLERWVEKEQKASTDIVLRGSNVSDGSDGGGGVASDGESEEEEEQQQERGGGPASAASGIMAIAGGSKRFANELAPASAVAPASDAAAGSVAVVEAAEAAAEAVAAKVAVAVSAAQAAHCAGVVAAAHRQSQAPGRF